MKIQWMIASFCCVGLLAGCSTHKTRGNFMLNSPVATVDVGDRRETIRFPEYFLMDGFELNEHGHIPNTRLFGAGMTTKFELSAVRIQFNDQLFSHKWKTDKMEIGSQYFRIMASHEGESVEIRAVQGSSGPTQIFLLYTPKPD